jgi:hypothetical protein
MARTYRSYPKVMEARWGQQAHPGCSFREPRTLSQLKAQAEVADLEEELYSEFGVRLRNRDRGRTIVTAWDDIPVACLNETKHIWKQS